jgi:ABC-type uncharacterized transport system substrate-binding protein
VLVIALHGMPTAAAHPHVWVDADVDLHFRDKKIESLRMTWVFDEIFTQTAIDDFGGAHKATLDQSGLQRLVATSTKSLKEYAYFTYLDVDGKRNGAKEVQDFTAEIAKGRLVYHFTVPVSPALDPQNHEFGFLLYDRTFFVDVAIADGHQVTYSGDVPGQCRETRKEDKKTPLYFGYFFPTLIRISCQ